MDTPPPLSVRVPAKPDHLAVLRGELRAWLTAAAVSTARGGDIILAADEALANAIEHGYAGTDVGEVHLRATADEHTVTVTVTDHGTWKPPTGQPGLTNGWGLPLITALAEHVSLDHADGATTLLARFRRTT
ncbi:ATP-binding protein [Actinokineospora inagensis]|uniref:ATP-binding protein n=1 Tax=Actinokineospora inagensis TaxID=103730 RepID=UPI000428CD1C|nr:ATP-binding protein [Actinokineospora inagensis]